MLSIINNNYQNDLRVLDTFVSNRSVGQFLLVSPKKLTFLKTLNCEFSYIGVWPTDQDSKLLEMEDKIIITLVIN